MPTSAYWHLKRWYWGPKADGSLRRQNEQCDETRPRCVNCTMVDRECVFPYAAELKSSRLLSFSGEDNTPESSSVATTPNLDTSAGSPAGLSGRSPAAILIPDISQFISHTGGDHGQASSQLADETVNIGHMKLLLNFSLDMVVPELDERNRKHDNEIVLKTSLEAPYLLYEVMAISARRLSMTEPTQADEYHHQAVQLQTQAISIFNAQKPRIDESTCTSLVLFSSIMGRHLCIDTLAFRSPDMDTFIGYYVNFSRIRRGVRTIVQRSWPLLNGSEISSLISWGLGLSRLKSVGNDCDGILHLITASSSLPQDSKEDCLQAVELVQIAVDDLETRIFTGRKHMIQIIFSWSLLVSDSFTQMIAERRPEALAILGHYAAILHLARDLWQIGDSGVYLLNLICQYLGPEWEEWLAWPRSIVFPDISEQAMSIDPSL